MDSPLLMATPRPGVREDLAFHRDKPPLVPVRVQCELQNAVSVIVVDFAVLDGNFDGVVALAPGANYELLMPRSGSAPPSWSCGAKR
jgi:hypothetical protein